MWRYAAVLLALVLMTAPFYTVTEKAARGEQATVRLPDRSTAMLNADSKLSYKPLGWFVSRKVTLEGEACFDVRKGSRFSVQSGRNQVRVLGTTFNVRARPDSYRVTCLDGRVEVSAGRQTVVLHAGMQAIRSGQEWNVSRDVPPGRASGWIEGKFEFAETPLAEVVAEIERQYDIRIASGSGLNHLYTGNFSRTEKPEDVLAIIGKPFGITFNIAGR